MRLCNCLGRFDLTCCDLCLQMLACAGHPVAWRECHQRLAIPRALDRLCRQLCRVFWFRRVCVPPVCTPRPPAHTLAAVRTHVSYHRCSITRDGGQYPARLTGHESVAVWAVAWLQSVPLGLPDTQLEGPRNPVHEQLRVRHLSMWRGALRGGAGKALLRMLSRRRPVQCWRA